MPLATVLVELLKDSGLLVVFGVTEKRERFTFLMVKNSICKGWLIVRFEGVMPIFWIGLLTLEATCEAVNFGGSF